MDVNALVLERIDAGDKDAMAMIDAKD